MDELEKNICEFKNIFQLSKLSYSKYLFSNIYIHIFSAKMYIFRFSFFFK